MLVYVWHSELCKYSFISLGDDNDVANTNRRTGGSRWKPSFLFPLFLLASFSSFPSILVLLSFPCPTRFLYRSLFSLFPSLSPPNPVKGAWQKLSIPILFLSFFSISCSPPLYPSPYLSSPLPPFSIFTPFLSDSLTSFQLNPAR